MMPIYCDHCTRCSREAEDIRPVSADTPLCCGVPMVKVPQVAGSAFITRGGNWYRHTPAAGSAYKAGGRPKPKTISRGNGLGGRRKPPSIRTALAQSGQAAEIRTLAKGKT